MHAAREMLGPWSDIYSVGATMYSCLSGAAPQPADARLEKDELVPASRRFSGSYSPELLGIVDQCMQLIHVQRPQSVLSLQKAILGEKRGSKPDHRPG
jgi:serine/threonine protein kinase